LAAAKARINAVFEGVFEPESAERLAAERRRYGQVFAAGHRGAEYADPADS
jgi:enoyl-CoA hydratase